MTPIEFEAAWSALVEAADAVCALPLSEMSKYVDHVERQVPTEALAAMAPVGRSIAAASHFQSTMGGRNETAPQPEG